MFLYREKILSKCQLQKLSEHKYSVESNSLLEPYLQPFWNWLVSKLPLWLAPNLITIIGLLVTILTNLILIFYDPDGKRSHEAPRWTYLLCALGLFIYQSLDSIDGKQARRTSSATPMGELFDHGCDSISIVFLAISTSLALQLGNYPKLMLIEFFCVLACFYCAHWQAYVTGTLQFGKIGVTESQFVVMSFYILTFLAGPEVWSKKIFGEFELWVLFLVMTVLVAFFILNDIVSMIQQGGSGKNGSTVAGTSILSPILPFLFIIIPSFVIAVKSKSGIYESHPTLYMITFGMLFAKVSNKLLIAHLSKSQMELSDSGMFGPAILFFNQYFNEFIPEYYTLLAALAWCSFDLIFYCSNVCLEICDYMNIKLFTIPYQKTSQGSTRNTSNGASRKISAI